jgi:hypothetical protein
LKEMPSSGEAVFLKANEVKLARTLPGWTEFVVDSVTVEENVFASGGQKKLFRFEGVEAGLCPSVYRLELRVTRPATMRG